VSLVRVMNDDTRRCFDPLQTQNIMRINRSVHDGFTAVYHLTVMHQNLFLFRNQSLVCYAVYISDNQTLFAFGLFTETSKDLLYFD